MTAPLVMLWALIAGPGNADRLEYAWGIRTRIEVREPLVVGRPLEARR